MGVLTDLVVASIEQADEVVSCSNPAADWHGVDAKGIDQTKLCSLRAIVTGHAYEDEWMSEFDFVAGDQEQGPWLFRFPDALTTALSTLENHTLDSAAIDWHRKSFADDHWPVESVRTALTQIRDLAIHAKRSDKPILMWICL
jgi:hypothetical protein